VTREVFSSVLARERCRKGSKLQAFPPPLLFALATKITPKRSLVDSKRTALFNNALGVAMASGIETGKGNELALLPS